MWGIEYYGGFSKIASSTRDMNLVDSLMKLLNSPGAELSLCLGLLKVSSSQCR